ncbi:DUF1772 domain-containing protein [Thermoactinospora rubra]|uniref:anthrone oxygenase family protein n=1 Tax=Thermoactinospora rubra TaxID=1088767 RepID=UPI000A1039E2|nr:anthrone oxygenase family protein [Thermoactinospora rubra]
METLALIAAFAALVTGAALAGLYYAFSMSVMPGLSGVAPADAEAAMRSVNRKIINPWLFLALMGTPVLAVLAGVFMLLAGRNPLWLFLAAGVNAVGSFLVTMIVNVPMNNALDAGTMPWSAYAPRWTRWNTARAVFSLASVVLVGIGLLAW